MQLLEHVINERMLMPVSRYCCIVLYIAYGIVYCYSAPDRGAEYCDERVCLCVLVCPRSYLRNYTSDLHLILCACYLWPWLGPLLAA